MLEEVYKWIQNIAVYLVVVTAMLHAVPGKDYERYIRFFSGLVLIVLIFMPVLSVFGMKETFGAIYSNQVYEKERKELEEAGNSYEEMLKNYIEENNLSQYYASIIVLTNEIDLLNQVINKKSVFTYSSKIDNINSFIDKVRELSKEKQDISLKNSIKEKISSELEYLGFDFSYIGTKYLYDCIYECYLSDTLYNINFSKHIYPILAKKYNKSQVLIKANIFQAIGQMYRTIDKDKLSTYFGYSLLDKPTTKEIIFTILQKIS